MARPSGRKTSQFQLGNVQQAPSIPSLDNDFRGGLKTEFTGLNFPENSCTSTSNCRFTRVGNVTRRGGIDAEPNFGLETISRSGSALSTFLWENAGGDGNTKIYVIQIGATLYFYLASAATPTLPISDQFITSIALSNFQISSPQQVECQYTSGNGYLFVFNPNCDPFYVTYSSGTISSQRIVVQIRDFSGVAETAALGFRPSVLTPEHTYNLLNQGWTAGSAWTGNSRGSITTTVGPQTFSLFTNSSSPLSNGDSVTFSGYMQVAFFRVPFSGAGSVTSYVSGSTLTLNVTSFNLYPGVTSGTYSTFLSSDAYLQGINFVKVNQGFLSTWFSAEGNYPSNSDIWYVFKDSSGNFNPAATQPNTAQTQGQAPQGHYILNAFVQDRASASGQGITAVSTSVRPRTGAWYQGRIWYAGVDASVPATGDMVQYSWTENIYFSQIVEHVGDFGQCYQNNDPTAQVLNSILPTDGGVIQIQGCGSIYKLFPVVNGLLVFAANGIWFITGDSGLGFTATDFSVSKLQGIHSISGTSFVNVDGWPFFWNADGIYTVQPGQSLSSGQRALEVKNLTLESIKTFYQNIPLVSKTFARGSYNHLTGEIQWIYRSNPLPTDGLTAKYSFDSVLVFLTYTGAFYPWTIAGSGFNAAIPGPNVSDVFYLEQSTSGAVPAQFYYLITNTSNNLVTIGTESSSVFSDWSTFTNNPQNYTSTFTTAYRLKGQALHKFQPQYVFVFSEQPTSQYLIQGIWNFATSDLSNKFSTQQVVNNNKAFFSKTYNKIRIRGIGYVLQFKISSSDGLPFNISGWSVVDTIGVM